MSSTTPKSQRGETFQSLVKSAKTRIQEIDVITLQTWQSEGKPLILLDVREPQDYENGHIAAAINLPRGELELNIDEMTPDQDAVLVTYCGGGSRSALAADTLQVMGYANVYSLAGGFRAWKQAHSS